MLNIIWPMFLIISFIYAIFSGRILEINNSIFESTKNAVELCLTLLGTICLWNGIMQIASRTSIILKLTKLIRPVMKRLFPDIKEDEEGYKEISMNIIANIMGLGNAATPLGLKAMGSLQKKNKGKNRLSNSMVIFIVLNTASIQIIPTTVIAIRSSLRFAKSYRNDWTYMDCYFSCCFFSNFFSKDFNEKILRSCFL